MDMNEQLVSFSVDTSRAFTTKELFLTRDDVVRWVREVGKANGVVVIILRSCKAGDKKGTKDKIVFGCNKHEKFNNISKEISSKKYNCSFKLRATYTVRDGGWGLRVICGLHTHELLTTLTGTSFFGRLTNEEKAMVDEHTVLKVAPRDSMIALKNKFVGNVSSMSQLYRQRTMYRSSLRGPRTEIQDLMRLIESEKYLCWKRKVEGTDVVSDIMWAHPTSIKLFRLFPKVLILNNTYKTNKYRIPLLEIVGVTSTELTFSVAFAYLAHERESHLTWALQMLKDLFEIHALLPEVFLTDIDLGLMSGINEVFPSSLNLLCKWRITKNVKAKCKVYVKVDRQESVIALWYNLIESADRVEYSQRLQILEQSCVDFPFFLKYLHDTWLTPHKHRFVLAWTNQVAHLGNTTTNRVESAQWALKRALGNSGGDLCRCWEAMNDMLNLHFAKIVESFQKSINCVEVAHSTPFYKKLRGVVSINALIHIAAEFEKTTSSVGYDKARCGCIIKVTHGLPCACELGVYHVSNTPIPLEAVDKHWCRLSLDGMDEDENKKKYVECDITYTMDMIWKRFNAMTPEERFVFKKQIDELAFPTMSSMAGLRNRPTL